MLSRPSSIQQLSVIAKTAKDVLNDYASIVEFVEPTEISPTSPDPDDDPVLACALGAAADIVVSGDPHLLNLKRFHTIDILSPHDAGQRIGTPR